MKWINKGSWYRPLWSTDQNKFTNWSDVVCFRCKNVQPTSMARMHTTRLFYSAVLNTNLGFIHTHTYIYVNITQKTLFIWSKIFTHQEIYLKYNTKIAYPQTKSIPVRFLQRWNNKFTRMVVRWFKLEFNEIRINQDAG